MAFDGLIFSDLFVADTPGESWYKRSANSLDCCSVPGENHGEVATLRGILDSMPPDPDFKVDFEGMRLRVQRMDTPNGSIYVCRRYLMPPDSLSALGFPTQVSRHLLGKDMKNGLILFTGSPGSGKTTTAMALLIELLKLYGGVCWTVENPVEINISGRHGKGICYQTEALDDSGFGKAIVSMKRASPNFILVGEIRDEDAARQALIAALSGRLVISTFHANNVTEGLEGYASLISNRNGLASAIRAVIHLELKPRPSSPNSDEKMLEVQPLLLNGAAESLRAAIRDGNFHMLKSEIERQRIAFLERH